MSNDDRFAIVRVPERGVARDSILSGAVMVGNLNAVMEQLPSTRARTKALMDMYRVADDAVAAEERRDAALEQEREAKARRDAVEVTRLRGVVERLSNCIDSILQRVDAEEQRRIRTILDSLPDPDKPDQDHPRHQPGGELHSIGPAEPRDPSYFDPDDSASWSEIPEPQDPTGVSLEMRR
jgi:hypothetical protein